MLARFDRHLSLRFEWCSTRSRQTHEFGRFVDSLADWKFFITPTHRRAVWLGAAEDCLRVWARKIARTLGEHLHIFWAVENGGMFGRAHSHALIAPLRPGLPINRDLLVQLWAADPTAGNIQVQDYIRGGGAGPYTGKAERWGYGVLCPREPAAPECRRRCVQGFDPFRR